LCTVDRPRLRKVVQSLTAAQHPGPLLMARAHAFAVADGLHARPIPRRV
jgi:hypothetical protein